MKHFVITLFVFFCAVHSARAALNYTESNLSVAFAYNTAPTILGELPPGIDDGLTNPWPIGFTFQFGSVLYTDFMVSSNGWMTFNTGCFGSDPNNQLAGNATQTANNERPIIAPLWDDLDVDATGNVNYQLTGTSPNRILTIEWKKMRWKFSATGPVISFQVKLYEGTNVIDMCYKQEATAVSSGSASIGLEGPSGTDYYSLTNTTAAPGVNHNVSEVTTLSAKPATNQVYRWTNNAAPLAVEIISFTGEAEEEVNSLHWMSATESMNDYFIVESSADGLNFTQLDRVNGHGTTSQVHAYQCIDQHPQQSVMYYRLKAIDYNGRITPCGTVVINRNDNSSARLYPLPCDDHISIDGIVESCAYTITDVTGRILSKGVLQQGNNLVNTSSLPGGVYFLIYGTSTREIEITHLSH